MQTDRLLRVLGPMLLLASGCFPVGAKTDAEPKNESDEPRLPKYRVHSVKKPKNNRYSYDPQRRLRVGEVIRIVVEKPFDKDGVRAILESLWAERKLNRVSGINAYANEAHIDDEKDKRSWAASTRCHFASSR